MPTKLRTLESPSGRGQVFVEERLVCAADYRLDVVQTMIIYHPPFSPAEEIPSTTRTAGRIRADKYLDVTERYILRLADGRRIEFFLTDSVSGDIACSDDFY